ncbi:MAG TPA: hypothetical protein VG125_30190 [Pirellulales bacterium]|nr:hypothetical protein [Pirellulales bacterium]
MNAGNENDRADGEHRADAAHPRSPPPAAASGPAFVAGDALPADCAPSPAQVVGSQCPAAIEKLELLDDTVFEAIAGRPGALDELRRLWPAVLAEVGPALVEESREQYLRHALGVWRQCVEGDQIRNPAVALATMEVICLLFADT